MRVRRVITARPISSMASTTEYLEAARRTARSSNWSVPRCAPASITKVPHAKPVKAGRKASAALRGGAIASQVHVIAIPSRSEMGARIMSAPSRISRSWTVRTLRQTIRHIADAIRPASGGRRVEVIAYPGVSQATAIPSLDPGISLKASIAMCQGGSQATETAPIDETKSSDRALIKHLSLLCNHVLLKIGSRQDFATVSCPVELPVFQANKALDVMLQLCEILF